MNILLCHPQKEVLEMIRFCLESELGLVVHEAHTFQDAVDCFLEETPIDLVVTSQQPETDKLFKYLLSTGADIPMILLIEDGKDNLNVYPDIRVFGQIRLSRVPDELILMIRTHFQQIEDIADNSEYIRIHTSLLTRVAPLRGDIFIRLSSVKFVKMFKTGAIFTEEDLQKFLVRRNVPFLFVKKSEANEFVTKFNEELSKMLAAAVPGDMSIFSTVTEVQDLIQELTKRLGFRLEIREMAQKNIKLALKAIGASPRITKVLSTPSLRSRNYISQHSVLLANIACSIAAQMKWPSDSTFQKLVVAALFHDFLIPDPELGKISSKEQLEKIRPKLTEDQFNLVKNHPVKVAEVIKSMSEVTSDVDTIVSQHHERPDGSGFPKGLRSQQIAPLSAVFIVAHDIVDAILTTKGGFDLKEFLKDHNDIYQGVNFRKVWNALMNPSDDSSSESNDEAA